MDRLFQGVATALITPFTENGVDLQTLQKLIDYQLEANIDAIVLLGSTGEPSTMSHQERDEVITFAISYINKRCKVIVGTGANNTVEAIAMSKRAEELGADGLLCVTPYYNKCTKNGIIKYYTSICESVNIPVIAYNVPARTGVNITPAVAEKLCEIPNLLGLKEASGDFVQIAETAFVMDGNKPLYCGDDETILPFLSLGASGTISVISNVMPKETKEMHTKFFAGDVKGAYEIYRRLYPLAHALFIEVNPIPAKKAMELLGFNTKIIREPLTEMEEANTEILKGVMKSLNLI